MGHSGNRGTRHVQLIDAEAQMLVLRHLPTVPRLYWGDEQHVCAVLIEIEPLAHVLAENAGRERPEAFAILTFRFSVFCIPKIERLPRARGPNSMRPCIQPTAF